MIEGSHNPGTDPFQGENYPSLLLPLPFSPVMSGDDVFTSPMIHNFPLVTSSKSACACVNLHAKKLDSSRKFTERLETKYRRPLLQHCVC